MLRSFLQELRDRNKIIDVVEELSVKYEISALMKYMDGKTLLFSRIKENNIFKIISGIVGSKENLKIALNLRENIDIYKSLENAAEHPVKPREAQDAEFLENTSDSLKDIPILYHYLKDGGPYITSALLYARDEENNFQNVSFHRLMLINNKKLAIRIVPRHLYTIFKKNKNKGKSTPVSIVIGVHPAVLISAAYPLKYGMDETWMANALLHDKLKVYKSPINELLVPSHAEILIEGEISHIEEVNEGPFVDITGTHDKIRRQPVVNVKKVYYREDPYYHALLPAGEEHKILMGLPREVKIWSFVRQVVPDVKDVALTSGGCGWLHAVISIKKHTEGDPKNVIMAAFSAHPSLKHCIVVDEDIDVRNPVDVEWAIATRFQGNEDLVVIKNARGSSLDPSADQENLLTTKIGIDATIPLTKEKKDFERASVPREIEERIKRLVHQMYKY
ncbi:MAG: UbiD family decarboxylase [Candidatus Asgardarchaeia archaeon]